MRIKAYVVSSVSSAFGANSIITANDRIFDERHITWREISGTRDGNRSEQARTEERGIVEHYIDDENRTWPEHICWQR